MSDLKRQYALAKLAPPYAAGKMIHLSPAEARDVYEYIVRLEMERDHWRDLVAAITAVKREEAT